jgi:hypothetical protein
LKFEVSKMEPEKLKTENSWRDDPEKEEEMHFGLMTSTEEAWCIGVVVMLQRRYLQQSRLRCCGFMLQMN